jgi:hypothetical protein
MIVVELRVVVVTIRLLWVRRMMEERKYRGDSNYTVKERTGVSV